MNITQTFDELGADIKNVRWSWGGTRDLDKRVFLRVWRDEIWQIDGETIVLVLRDTNTDPRRGWRERAHHIVDMMMAEKWRGVALVYTRGKTSVEDAFNIKRIEWINNDAYAVLGRRPHRNVIGNILGE